MKRLAEWKRRINATQLSDDDKQKACDGLDRIWATGEGELDVDYAEFGGLFHWRDTDEYVDFWISVNTALLSADLATIDSNPISNPSAIQQLIDAAKRYKRLRDLAERAEENYESRRNEPLLPRTNPR